MGTCVAATLGAGELSGLSGVDPETVTSHILQLSKVPAASGQDVCSPRPGAISILPSPPRCARSERNACQTLRWRSTC